MSRKRVGSGTPPAELPAEPQRIGRTPASDGAVHSGALSAGKAAGSLPR